MKKNGFLVRLGVLATACLLPVSACAAENSVLDCIVEANQPNGRPYSIMNPGYAFKLAISELSPEDGGRAYAGKVFLGGIVKSKVTISRVDGKFNAYTDGGLVEGSCAASTEKLKF